MLKTFENINKDELERKGVQALADNPNRPSRYGQGGLSPLDLKKWFDQLAFLLADKINDIYGALSSEEAAAYIKIALKNSQINDLASLISAMEDGTFAENILRVHPTASAPKAESLRIVINNIAKQISDLGEIANIKKIEEIIKGVSYTKSETDEKIAEALSGSQPEQSKTFELINSIEITESGVTNEVNIITDSDGDTIELEAFYLFIDFPISTEEKTLDGYMQFINEGNAALTLLNFYASKTTNTTAKRYYFASGRVEYGMWCDVWKSLQTKNDKDDQVTKTFFNHSEMPIKLNCTKLRTCKLKFTSGKTFDTGTKIYLYGVRRYPKVAPTEPETPTTYTLSGVWKFNDELIDMDELVDKSYAITFRGTDDMGNAFDIEYSNIGFADAGYGDGTVVMMYDNTVVADSSSGWYPPYGVDKRVDFGTVPQAVSEIFYKWFIVNAKEM